MSEQETFDNIDHEILDILAKDPRAPYTEITERLNESGYDMSSEGVRYRVGKVLDTTTVFFLLDPQEITWEVVRVAIKVNDEPNAKEEVFEWLCELPFWHISRGLGSFDVFAVGTVPDVPKADSLVTKVRENNNVDTVEYMLVTDRNRDMKSYVSLDYLTSEL